MGIKSEELKKYLDFAYSAYQENNNSGQAYRQNGRVPYLMHPLWCASMLIADSDVPFEHRELGVKALILHDVLEDTSLELPDWVTQEVKDTVEELTFDSLEEAIEKYDNKTPFIKLLMLYDKLSSMYENHVAVNPKFSEEEAKARRRKWKNFVERGIVEVEKEYGNIRIVQVAKVVADNTDW